MRLKSNRNYILNLLVFLWLFTPMALLAASSVSGTLQGVDRYSGTYQLNKTSGGSVTLPSNTVFEGGAVNGTIYTCSYTGTANAMKTANCKVKTASAKGNLAQSGSSFFLADINSGKEIMTLPASTTYAGGTKSVGSYYICNYKGNIDSPTAVTCTVDSTAGSTAAANKNTSFRLFSNLTCPNTEALTCWIARVFNWSQTAILLFATVVIVIAGIVYMTSAGNVKQTTLSKKLIMGALSGVAVIVLGKLFLTVVIGVPWL